MKPKGQGNNPLRIYQSDVRISIMKFSHWLERRDKHEVMRAIKVTETLARQVQISKHSSTR